MKRVAIPVQLTMLLGLVVIVAAVTNRPVFREQVTLGLIYTTLVVSLYIFTGLSGILSFGSVSFAAIGAYVGALVTIPVTQKEVLLPNLPGFLARADLGTVEGALLAGAIAMVVALVVGIPLMRLSGLAASLGTLAVLVIVNVVATNWVNFTRGDQAMLGVPLKTTMVGALVYAVIAIAIAFSFQESRTGARLRAFREDEVAARACGIGGFPERLTAFSLSAFVGGLGGFAFAEYLTTFNPGAFYTDLTFLTLAMLVVGGMFSLSGAVVGSVVISALDWVLERAEQGFSLGPVHVAGRPGTREIGFAAVMLLILLVRPQGLTGGREVPPVWSWRVRFVSPFRALEKSPKMGKEHEPTDDPQAAAGAGGETEQETA